MEVVNVKVKYIRPKYANLKEWMSDPDNVYIGRGGVVFVDGLRWPKQDSVWANPYKIGRDGDRQEVLAKYKQYINEKIKKDKEMIAQLHKLKGKLLGCWCKPEECHGDILISLIEEYVQ